MVHYTPVVRHTRTSHGWSLSIRLSDEDLKKISGMGGANRSQERQVAPHWECQCCLLLKRRCSRTLIWWVNYQEGAKVLHYDFAPESRSMHNLQMVMGSSRATITLDLKASQPVYIGEQILQAALNETKRATKELLLEAKPSSWTRRSWLSCAFLSFIC